MGSKITIDAGEVREDDDSYVSPLDELFDRLEMVNPEHIALKYYRDYRLQMKPSH